MEAKPINLTMKVIFSRAIFECAGFFAGMVIGVNVGFVMAFMYLVMGGD